MTNQPQGGQPPEMPGTPRPGDDGVTERVPAPSTPTPSDPDHPNAVRETLAGLAGAIGSVPDGMATAVLAGANPVTGLYASFAGPGDAGGRMFLSGVDPQVADQIASNGLIGAEDLTVVEATDYLGESTRQALAEGQAWLREMPEAVGTR